MMISKKAVNHDHEFGTNQYAADMAGITIDVEGKIVERTKKDYPYSYSLHATWAIMGEKRNKIMSTMNTSVVYSDRLHQFDSAKYNRYACQVFDRPLQDFTNCSPNKIEEFLQLYYSNEDLVLYRIQEECNSSNGYPVWVFDFAIPKE